MRIACLQFAPQVGDIDNNLNRADAVLSKANPEDLDLLVLPELAFTGYNFQSLQEISPFLEPQGSGISALWARTTALKHNCVVTVGYPEKVDVKPKWPTSPEYYNSVIVVNGEGETIANYRKSFLYTVDETWALEGQDGFFEGYIPGLGHTSMGICMDLNPYKFEAPWHAFEFAFHILEMESNFVIVTMAWLTREEGRMFSRMPKEPDMDTLTYWITRLEPLIRSENDEEIIVVFCNRTGTEGDAVYAGTSAVVGIKGGEVNVYGILGRGDKELLVVDTDAAPFAKLVYRPDGDSTAASVDGDSNPKTGAGIPEADTSATSGKAHYSQPTNHTEKPSTSSAQDSSTQILRGSEGSTRSVRSERSLSKSAAAPEVNGYDHIPRGSRSYSGSVRSTLSNQGSTSSRESKGSKGSKTSKSSKDSKRSQSSQGTKCTQESRRSKNSSGQTRSTYHSIEQRSSNHSGAIQSSRRPKPDSPKIRIPTPSKDSNTVPTPTGPSPTPLALRPKLVIPSDAHSRPSVPHVPTPHPSTGAYKPRDARIYGGHVSIHHHNEIMTPTTAFDDLSPTTASFFWVPSDSMLRTPLEPRMWTPALADSPTVNSNALMRPRDSVTRKTHSRAGSQLSARSLSRTQDRCNVPEPKENQQHTDDGKRQPDAEDESQPARPSSPKSRNASRPRHPERADSALADHHDLAAIAQRLEALSPRPGSAATQRMEAASPRPGSAMGQRSTMANDMSDPLPQRPSSPKSRNASRTRPLSPGDPLYDGRQESSSPISLENHSHKGPTALTYRPDVRMTNIEAAFRPNSRVAHSRSGSISGPDCRPSYRTGTPAIPERTESRAASRGRNRAPREIALEERVGSTQPDARDTSIPARRPSAPSFGFRNPAEFEAEVVRISPECPVHGSHRQSNELDENEIIREIVVRSSPNCPAHGHLHHDRTRHSPNSTAVEETKELVQPEASANSQVEACPGLNNCSSSVETSVSVEASPATPNFDPKTPQAMILVRDDDTIPTTPLSAPFLLGKLIVPRHADRELIVKSIVRPKSAVW